MRFWGASSLRDDYRYPPFTFGGDDDAIGRLGTWTRLPELPLA
ncbi:hypothetical protein ACVWY5_006928 [Bradyrhizobium sp. USDA 3256]